MEPLTSQELNAVQAGAELGYSPQLSEYTHRKQVKIG